MTDQSPAYHFAVIGRALAVIDEAPPGLTLDDLAARMNMSPAHFQRTFSQWVGVSPKRYQQYLTLTHARRLLAERHTTLATAHDLWPVGHRPAARSFPDMGGNVARRLCPRRRRADHSLAGFTAPSAPHW